MKSILLILFTFISLSAFSQNSVKTNFNVSLPNSDFKASFGNGANILHSVGFLSRRSTKIQNLDVHQAQQLVEFNFGETESIINGVKVKHTKFESEGYFKGYSVMIAFTKKADFSQIIVTHKNGLIYSVTLLKTNHDYILFE